MYVWSMIVASTILFFRCGVGTKEPSFSLSDLLMLVLFREYYDGNNMCINALYYTCGGMMWCRVGTRNTQKMLRCSSILAYYVELGEKVNKYKNTVPYTNQSLSPRKKYISLIGSHVVPSINFNALI